MTGNNLSVATDAPALEPSRLLPAFGAGLAAALLGAVIWAVVTVLTKYQIGWMAIGVGFLVGYAIRTVGRGDSMIYGVMGALLALSGCIAGNVLSTCGFVSIQESASVWSVLGNLNPSLIANIVVESFDGMDLVFYAIAAYEGYKLSFAKPTDKG